MYMLYASLSTCHHNLFGEIGWRNPTKRRVVCCQAIVIIFMPVFTGQAGIPGKKIIVLLQLRGNVYAAPCTLCYVVVLQGKETVYTKLSLCRGDINATRWW